MSQARNVYKAQRKEINPEYTNMSNLVTDPLVSICIITYNSADTVVETLNSIYNQTYKNIELIIGDDSSSDNTVDICNNWVERNAYRFESCQIITSDINSGVPTNCNRTLSYVSGKWIKVLAGDDLLLPNAIANLIEFVKSDAKIEFVYTSYYVFKKEDSRIKVLGIKPPKHFIHRMADITNNNQLITYIKSKLNITVTLFYSTELYNRSGGFNEQYRLFEDTPWIVKVLSKGEVLYYCDIKTVLYRTGHPSITHDYQNCKDKYFIKEDFYSCVQQFRRDCIYPIMPKYDLIFWIDEYSNRFLMWLIINILQNKRNPFTQSLYYLFKILNPYYLVKFICSKLW